MAVVAFRHKHVLLDQRKLDRARRALGARTETETLDRALDLVVSEADIDRVLRAARGKGKIEIEYYSADDLDRIYDIIVGPK